MNIAVVFLTYSSTPSGPRNMYALQSMRSLLQNLSFRDGALAYFIADDGSPPEHTEALHHLFIEKNNKWSQGEGEGAALIGGSNSERRGYGGSFNLASQGVHGWADLVLPVEDDWELVRPFDLSDMARAFNDEIQCIRLGYLGWTDDLRGKLVQSAGQSFILFDPYSPEKHVWAGHPRLETVEYQRRVGPWPEGLKAGFTELEVGKREEARTGVAWPLDADVNASQDYCRLFAHIGEEQA
jgi:hypothetical protein